MREEKGSWNESTNAWHRRETFGWKLRNKWLRPRKDLIFSKKVVGWTWRILLILLLPLYLFDKYKENRLESDNYFSELTNSLNTQTNSNSVFTGPIAWTENGLKTTKEVQVKFNDSPLLDSLYAYSCSIRGITAVERLKGNWNHTNLNIQRAELLLKGANPTRLKKEIASSTISNPASRNFKIALGGFLQPPNQNFNIKEIRIGEANIYWGEKFNFGQLLGGSLTLQRTKSGWKGNLKNAILTQNWITNLKINSADVLWNQNKLEIKNIKINEQDSSGEGEIVLNESLNASFQYKFKNLDLDHIVPGVFKQLISGTVNGEIMSTGKIIGGEVFTTQCELQLSENITIKEPNLMFSLAQMTKNKNFSSLPVDTGEIQFTTTSGEMEKSSFHIISKNFANLAGDISYHNSELKLIGKLGIEPHVFKSIPKIQEMFFSEVIDDMYYTDINIEGAINGKWMNDKKLEIEKAYETHYNSEPKESIRNAQ